MFMFMFMFMLMRMIAMALPRMAPTLYNIQCNSKHKIPTVKKKKYKYKWFTKTTGPSCLALYRIQNLQNKHAKIVILLVI